MTIRNYKHGYPSVTKILGQLRKVGLEFWFKQDGMNLDKLSSDAKNIGTQLHDYLQGYFCGQHPTELDTKYPKETMNLINRFAKFIEDTKHKGSVMYE